MKDPRESMPEWQDRYTRWLGQHWTPDAPSFAEWLTTQGADNG